MKQHFFLIGILFIIACQHETTPIKSKPPITLEQSSNRIDTFLNIPIVTYQTSPDKISFFLQDERGKYFNNHGNLKQYLEDRDASLLFAMNGGMYLKDCSPQGLYIEQGVTINKLNKKKSTYGNFYLQPNGVFYIDQNRKAYIQTTKNYAPKNTVRFATQSGPMLLIEGKIHSKFTVGSKHLHIRNGVGILSTGDLLFAMSKKPISFYDFALFFAEKGCKNALYLDGAISKTYLPAKGVEQLNGQFGVIIAETSKR